MYEAHAKPTIFVIDDTADNLILIANLLKPYYTVKVVNSGEKGLAYLSENALPELILLDIMMPGLSGYDVISRLKADLRTHHIPVIFLTAMSSPEDEKKGLELGAVDYITKPISPAILLARIKTHLENKAMADFLRDRNAFLEQEIAKRTQEISAIQMVTISTMTSLAETRDTDTGNHIVRTQHYVKLLAMRLKNHPRFHASLNDATIETLFRSAPLHDIGKVGIPDAILLKKGKLTPEEFEIMKTHAELGYKAIHHAQEQLETDVEFLKTAKEIAYTHHEKWDGTGYPRGLKGDEIPISGRLMAVADVYDALINRRVYKEAYTHQEAVKIMIEGRGTHFDPDVLDAFMQLQTEFTAIAQQFSS
jgi:putative two-component system response regulator